MTARKVIAVTFLLYLFFSIIIVSTASCAASKCYNAGSTLDMTKCLEKETEKAETKLEKVYFSLLTKRKTEDEILNRDGMPGGASAYSAKALELAQAAWLKFRNANCDFQHSLSYPGTGASIDYGFCIIRMTEERTAELKKESIRVQQE